MAIHCSDHPQSWKAMPLNSCAHLIFFTFVLISCWVPIESFNTARGHRKLVSNGFHRPRLEPLLTVRRKSFTISSMQTDDSSGTSKIFGNAEKTTFRPKKSTNVANANAAVVEAEKLRQKAKDLMNEANAAEVALRSSKQEADDMRNSKLDAIFDDLQVILDPVEEGQVDLSTDTELNIRLANILKEKRLSSPTMEQLVIRIYERSISAEEKIRNSNGVKSENQSENNFKIGDVSNSVEYNETQFRLLQWWTERIIAAQSILDKDDQINPLAPVLESKIRNLKRAEDERYQRRLAMKLNSDQGTLVNNFSKETMGEQNITIVVDGKEISGPQTNITRLMEDIIQVPQWVPSSILPFLVVAKTEIDSDTFKKIRSEVLGGSSFNVENCDYTRTAAIFRGSFVDRQRAALYGANSVKMSEKSKASGEEGKNGVAEEEQSTRVFREVEERLAKAGLADELQMFLMEDPEWRPGDRDPEPLPSILVVSTNVIPEQGVERGRAKKAFAALAVVSTFVSTLAYAISSFALNPSFFDSVVNNNDISKLSSCLPIMLGLLSVNLVHEIAHRIAATKTGMKVAFPVPLPSLQLGSFGSITALRSFPKSRSAMFDFAVSGPISGAIVSIVLMAAGISLTIQASPQALSSFAVVPAAITKTSFLVGTITSFLAPKVMSLPASQLIPIHPIFLVGFAGLISSALNLLPIGRLDGGRACTAILGRRSSYIVSFATLLFLAVAALTQTSAISIFWGLLVTLFQRNADIPMRDELSDVDDFRVGVYISCIVLVILTLAPFPGGPIL